jgi:glycosyltransferase involved in cell wall biosynthesis
VVARAGSSLSQAIEEAGAGFVVDEQELDRAAFEIVAVLTAPGAYEAMATRARELACQRYSLRQMVLAYERIYRGG